MVLVLLWRELFFKNCRLNLRKKTDKIRKFLEKGDQVKVVVRFRGREKYMYKESGMELVERISTSLEKEFVSTPKFVGSSIVAIIK